MPTDEDWEIIARTVGKGEGSFVGFVADSEWQFDAVANLLVAMRGANGLNPVFTRAQTLTSVEGGFLVKQNKLEHAIFGHIDA